MSKYDMIQIGRFLRKHQAAVSMVIALFVFALFSMWQPARSDELQSRLEKHELKFEAKCIRGPDSAEMWANALMEDWGEVPVWMGTNDGGRIIVTRNSNNPTWTFLIETAAGTCLVSSGSDHFLNDVDGAAKKLPSKTDQDATDDNRV